MPTIKSLEEKPRRVKGKVEETEELESVSRNSVYVEKSITKNLGDYNSAKITVGITLYVNPTDEEIEAAEKTIEVASSVVNDRLELELDELEREQE
jgi:hypothetical protein